MKRKFLVVLKGFAYIVSTRSVASIELIGRPLAGGHGWLTFRAMPVGDEPAGIVRVSVAISGRETPLSLVSTAGLPVHRTDRWVKVQLHKTRP